MDIRSFPLGGTGFSCNSEQRYTAVVATVGVVTRILVQGCDDGIPHVLMHCALFPAMTEKFIEFGEQHRLGTFDDFWRNAFTSRGFPVCQAVYDVTELFL